VFVREVKQQDVPLRLNRELAVNIIRTIRCRDVISLILKARDYIKERLPVRDRAMPVASLLQRDAVCDFIERAGSKRIRVVEFDFVPALRPALRTPAVNRG
jgi:hypothetical protein